MSKYIVVNAQNLIIELVGEYVNEQNMLVFKASSESSIPNIKYYPSFQTLEAAKEYLLSARSRKVMEILGNIKKLQSEFEIAVKLLDDAINPEIKVLE